MSRRCEISGKHTVSGNTIGFTDVRTKRTFKANLQRCTVYDSTLDAALRLKITPYAMRLIRRYGGLSNLLRSNCKRLDLSASLKHLRQVLRKNNPLLREDLNHLRNLPAKVKAEE
jgi:large subunit ribosomal protein L28